MTKLPKVYEGVIDKEINNNKVVFSSVDRNIINKKDINKEIDNIFNSRKHVYKSRVELDTLDGIMDKVIIGKTNNHLITMDGELIDISKINDIKKIY